MPPANARRSMQELARLGSHLFEQTIRAGLRPEDEGKFIAIDVESGAYDLDQDDYAAVARLRSRIPAADIWLMRAGFPATCRIGRVR